jgi:hypothetical protein
MSVNRDWVRTYLKQFDFESLFLEELGWDSVDLNLIPVGVEGAPYQAEAIAQKRGMVVYHCQSEKGQSEKGGDIPDNGVRRKIDHQINSYSREHLIIYSDALQQEQVWQWVRREKGKPLAPREYRYHIDQDGESLVQKLEGLAIDFDEEDGLTLTEVAKRTKKAFDVDRVTKKFYERFQKEHQRFLAFVEGIQERFDQEWYCSVMLNRLMFVYFLQKKGFLDGDRDYLRNRLNGCQQAHGDDEFYSFYRYFLLRLFHEGLGDSKRDSAELEQLIGKIPYLNGGLFDVHELEERNPDIQIPDGAFEAIFNFFDDYQWHLDDRPLRNDREINPDVLGYIFEKYINEKNQKQKGAYYTKEDITEYISKNTIIPFLFDAAKKACAIVFEPDGPVWRLLKENPERYIYDAVKKGVIKEDPKTKITEVISLPADIEAGIEDVSQRGGWNRLVEADYALPTELWREHVARRQRCLKIRDKLANGEVHEINDLITYNLDIRQFAQDVIEQCEGPELLRAFYKAISQISVLDPTCGSGAFLFAALNILEPLYDACLHRMKGFVEDLDRSGEKSRPEKFSDFRKILEQVKKHPNREYFILKSIILGNLYGVDIMEEAVEICKLRLFLKLVSQVDAEADKPNYGLEPLPDIDFNIRAGNTLVGFATYDEVKKAVEGDGQQKLDLFSDMPRIDESAEIADRAFQMFRSQQTEHDMDGAKFKDAKVEVRRRLKELNDELNRYLASEYDVDTTKMVAFERWAKSHRPFHWFVEFYRIVKDGGFSVIVGNPPYVEISEVRKQYSTTSFSTNICGNIYGLIIERSFSLTKTEGKIGMIVPMSLSCTARMSELRRMLESVSRQNWISHFSGDANPSKLFEGVKLRLDILISTSSSEPKVFSSCYTKWFAEERNHIFSFLTYSEIFQPLRYLSLIPKLGGDISRSIFSKILEKNILNDCMGTYSQTIYVHRVLTMYVKCFNFVPYFWNEQDGEKKSDDYKPYRFKSEEYASAAIAIINSSIFFFYFITLGDCFHCGKEFIQNFPAGLDTINPNILEKLSTLGEELMDDMKSNAVRRVAESKKTGRVKYDEFWPRYSKSIIDTIDYTLATHYGLTDEEIDFVVNYDIKYRMGLRTLIEK